MALCAYYGGMSPDEFRAADYLETARFVRRLKELRESEVKLQVELAKAQAGVR